MVSHALVDDPIPVRMLWEAQSGPSGLHREKKSNIKIGKIIGERSGIYREESRRRC